MAHHGEGVITSKGAVDFNELGIRPPRPWSEALDAYYLDLPEEVARSAWRRLRAQAVRPFEGLAR
ncbi:hypothetical protein [Nocardioides pyridinolyticus]